MRCCGALLRPAARRVVASQPAAKTLSLKSAAHSVSLNDSCIELVRDDVASKVVDCLARNTSSLSDLLDLLVSGDTNLLEGSWKTNLKAEVLDLVELLLRNTLKNKLDQGTKSNAVAVRCAVATKGGEAVVEGVSCCAVNVVSADTTPVDGCLAELGLQRCSRKP